MLKLFFAIFIMTATTLMGSFVLVVLTVPSLAANDAQLILPAAAAGFIVALPVSYLITRKINNAFKS